MRIDLNSIQVIVFDFDGVLTNNLVYLNEFGDESVACNRSDGLAFDVLRKLEMPCYILSTEKNKVVSARAKKLRIEALQGIKNKKDTLITLAKDNGFSFDKILYVGNDLNDYQVMQACHYSACPGDSHDKIKNIATVVLKTNGGNGVVRELLEDVFSLDIIKILYSE